MKSFFLVLKKVGLILLVITVLSLLADQWLTGQMESLLSDPEGTSNRIWFYGFLSLILSLLYPLSTLSLTIASLTSENVLGFLGKNLGFLMKEQLRAWGQVMLWSLLLILPGIYKFIQLMLVPFVVCLDPAYSQGKADALQTAKRLSQGQRLKLLGLLALFAVVFPVLITLADEHRSFFRTPMSALLICFVEMLINLSFALLLWTIFRRSSHAQSHDSDLSVERN
jgi:hypothetical protein